MSLLMIATRFGKIGLSTRNADRAIFSEKRQTGGESAILSTAFTEGIPCRSTDYALIFQNAEGWAIPRNCLAVEKRRVNQKQYPLHGW